MNAAALKKARTIRGVTIAERYVYGLYCMYYHPRSPYPFLGSKTIAYEIERSVIYVREILRKLVQKRFLIPRKHYKNTALFSDAGAAIPAFEIDFDRWFPYESDEKERQNKKALACFRHSVESPELAKGFLAAWIEPPPSRSKRVRERLFIAIESATMLRHMKKHEASIVKALREEFGRDFDIRAVDTFIKLKDAV